MPRESRDAFREKWEAILTDAQKNLHDAILAGDTNKVKILAIAAGIASEKTLLFSGLPTQIISGLDAQGRADLPQLLHRLARIGQEPSPPPDLPPEPPRPSEPRYAQGPRATFEAWVEGQREPLR